MTRVLVTGGAGTLGAAVVRRLLGDPDYEVRVSDQRAAPGWMREGCEVHRGDLRVLGEARKAFAGCTHAIHLAGDRRGPRQPAHAHRGQQRALATPSSAPRWTRTSRASSTSSSSTVYERAHEFPTPEDHVCDCPPPRSAYGFSKLTGEAYCRAAAAEHGLRYTICRPFNAYGPGGTDDAVIPDLIRKSLAGDTPLPIYGSGEQTRTFTHLDDVADGIVCAMARPAAAGRGVQHRLARGDLDRRARADLLGGVRARPGGARARDRAAPQGGRPGPRAARRSRRRASCWGGRRRWASREGVAQTAEWLRDTEVAA